MGRISVKENKNLYQLKREALGLSRDRASELLEGISPEHPDVLYLRLHLADLCGDADTAQTVRRKLSGMTSEYLHYRFLNQPSNHDAPTRCATQKS